MLSQRLIPVVEYVRMSTEDQKYSIPNQQAAIRKYAAQHGFSISRTYADPGKSGVLIKHREGLSKLLQDVVAGKCDYQAILAYDVSRWGRFQNPDEAAHYEFICSNAGIPVHYCAEQFSNDGSIQSSLMKAIKRTMAGEFSRELGIKVFDGLSRLVAEGYYAGGVVPYGLGRMMISASGQKKGILKAGERKNLKTDKVILIRGLRREIDCVRRIFSMSAKNGWTCSHIAAELNSNHITYRGGRNWDCDRVLRILRDPRYMGVNVWARKTRKLSGRTIRQPRTFWITGKVRFKPIIDGGTFAAAQRTLKNSRTAPASPEAMLAALKRLLAKKGQLTAGMIDKSRALCGSGTYFRRFGSLLRAYELAGFKPSSSRVEGTGHSCRTRSLRETILREIQQLFPNEVRISCLDRRHKRYIEVDRGLPVSLLLCGRHSRQLWKDKSAWLLRISPREKETIALICLLDSKWGKVVRYQLVPPLRESIRQHHTIYSNDALLTRFGEKLKDDLSDFCEVVRRLALRTDGMATVSAHEPPVSICDHRPKV